MKPLRLFLDKIAPAFEKGGKLEILYPLYEATDTFLYTTDEVTTVEPHVRDSMDLKRIMTLVVYAMGPCILMAMWNTGYQANTAMPPMTCRACSPVSVKYSAMKLFECPPPAMRPESCLRRRCSGSGWRHERAAKTALPTGQGPDY